MELLQNSCQNHFKTSLERCLPHLVGQTGTLEEKGLRKLFFGDYIYPDAESKVYDEVRISACFDSGLSDNFRSASSNYQHCNDSTYLLISKIII